MILYNTIHNIYAIHDTIIYYNTKHKIYAMHDTI